MENSEVIIVFILALTALVFGLSIIDTRHMREVQSDIADNKVLLKRALDAIINLEQAVDDLREEIQELKNNQK